MDDKNIEIRIYLKVLALFSKYGIRSITMDDIARELGVSKKTLYTIVSDKSDLISKVIDYEMTLHHQSMDEMIRLRYNAIDELLHMNKQIHAAISSHHPSFYHDLKKYYPDLFLQWMDQRQNYMFDVIIRNIENGKREGFYRKDLNEQIIAKLYLSRIEMLNENGVLKDGDSISHNIIKEVFIYHVHGICNAEGLEYFSLHQEGRLTNKND